MPDEPKTDKPAKLTAEEFREFMTKTTEMHQMLAANLEALQKKVDGEKKPVDGDGDGKANEGKPNEKEADDAEEAPGVNNDMSNFIDDIID